MDVILVIDRSGSMGEGSPTSLWYAKQAAKSFAAQILADPDNRVGVVSYGTNATINEQVSTNNLDDVEDAIDSNT